MRGQTARIWAAVLMTAGMAYGQRGPRNNPPPPPPPQPTPAQPAQPPQPAQPQPAQPAVTTPANPAGPGAPIPLDIPSPYLKQGRERAWEMHVRLMVRAPKERDGNNMPIDQSFSFDSAVLVFPILRRTGSARLLGEEGAWPIGWTLTIDDRDAGAEFEYVVGHPGGTDLGKWTVLKSGGNEVRLEVRFPVVCAETQFDERSASRVGWPKGPWPDQCQVTFRPQMFLDFGPDERGEMRQYDLSGLDALLKEWTEGKDPKTVAPVTLAKWLAGRVQEFYQPSGQGLSWSRLGELEGIDVQGVERSVRIGRGSAFDMAALLAAVYRRAGLPARVVIGYDAREEEREGLFRRRGSRSDNDLRPWVEFALWDEATQTLTWVPVDIVRLRRSGTRMKRLDIPWDGFGSGDEWDEVIPLAHHFHPPTTVRAYNAPAMWGWFVIPQAPDRLEQAVWMGATTLPNRGGAGSRPGS